MRLMDRTEALHRKTRRRKLRTQVAKSPLLYSKTLKFA